jgi:UDP-N-acetyl-D-glucosamine dehydrogenase
VGFHERFIETAGDINSRMPDHVVELVGEALNDRGKPIKGSSVLILGVAFKSGVSDDRNSPAGPLMSVLRARGAKINYHDPRLAEFAPDGHGMGDLLRSAPLEDALAAHPDCVVIVTPHPEIDWELVFHTGDLIVDTRNVSHGRPLRPRQVLRLGAGWN